MTLLTVVQDVCGVVGVHRPASIFSGLASNRTAQEMLTLANEMAQRIAYDEREWTALWRTATISGNVFLDKPSDDRAIESWHAIPADYKRMLLSSNLYRGKNPVPMRFVSDRDEWLRNRLIYGVSPSGFSGEWILSVTSADVSSQPAIGISPPLNAGGKPINPSGVLPWAYNHIYSVDDLALDVESNLAFKCLTGNVSPAGGTFSDYRALNPGVWTVALTPPETVRFNYLTKNCIALASGGANDAFISDNDVFALGERILKLGMIWQWKANKGSPYAEDMASYEAALARVEGADKPSAIIVGNVNISTAARTAYPFPTPTSNDWSWPL